MFKIKFKDGKEIQFEKDKEFIPYIKEYMGDEAAEYFDDLVDCYNDAVSYLNSLESKDCKDEDLLIDY